MAPLLKSWDDTRPHEVPGHFCGAGVDGLRLIVSTKIPPNCDKFNQY